MFFIILSQQPADAFKNVHMQLCKVENKAKNKTIFHRKYARKRLTVIKVIVVAKNRKHAREIR